MFEYLSSGSMVFGNTSPVTTSRWTYTAFIGKGVTGKSALAFTDSSSSAVSSRWVYTALIGKGVSGKSVLEFTDSSSSIASSYRSYTALIGKGVSGKSVLEFTDSSSILTTSRWTYTAFIGKGVTGKSALEFTDSSVSWKIFYGNYTPFIGGVAARSQLRFTESSAVVEESYSVLPVGNAVLGGTANVFVNYGNYNASGNVVFGGSSATTSNAWDANGNGNAVFGGNAFCIVNHVDYTPTGNGVFGGSFEFAVSAWSYDSSGNVVFGNTSVSTSNAWEYLTSGNGVFGGSASVSFSFINLPTSNIVFGGSALCNLSIPFNASGGIVLSGDAVTSYEFNAELDLTWDISSGILRYYRIEGKPVPYDLGGSPCIEGQCIRSFLNIEATSVSDVCEKLKARNFSIPVKSIQVFSIPVLKEDQTADMDLSKNTLSDVNINIPECLSLLTDFSALVKIGAVANVVVITNYSYSCSGGSCFGGDSVFTSSGWDYSASGNIVFSDVSSDVSSPQYFICLANGNMCFDGSEASYFSNNLGVFVSDIGGTASLISTNYLYGFQSTNLLQPITTNIDSICCGELPPLLYLNHNYRKFSKLNNFLYINNLNIVDNLRLVYSKKNNTWINNLYLKGISVNNDSETWNIISEFGCIDNFSGLPFTGKIWALSLSVINKNLRTGIDKYTNLVLSFDPNIICNTDQSMDNSFVLNVITKEVIPATVQSTVFYDEIGLMKGTIFNSNNPLVNFRVTSFAIPSLNGNIDNSEAVKGILL